MLSVTVSYTWLINYTLTFSYRYIFFTDVGASVQRVAKATTDGSNVEVLAPKSPRNQLFTSPTALALNRKTKTVIFADSEGAVFTIGYDGSNIRRITKVCM